MDSKIIKTLLDSSFIAALRLLNDKNHQLAKELLSLSEYPTRDFVITDYILDEVLTLLWVRSKKKSLMKATYAK